MKKILITVLSVMLALSLAILSSGCSPDTPCAHRDANDDGKCDTCAEAFSDKCDLVDCRDANDDGKCDTCGVSFSDECDLAAHRDANDDGECDACGVSFSDKCDVGGCRDLNDDGSCDKCGEHCNDGCDAEHRDANDNGKCDEGNEPFSDRCDKTDCRDANDDRKCDKCGFDFDDGDEPELTGKKVLLVSIDGLRPDALVNSKYYAALKALGSYTMSAQTINPSVTLPAHMSMFHSVNPDIHGVTDNNYRVSTKLKNGITETLTASGQTCAMFFDWEKLKFLTKLGAAVERNYVNGSPSASYEWFEESTVTLSDMAIDHMKNTPTDFTFLYYALADEMGHTYKWMSDKYKWGIDHILENLLRVLAEVPDDYVVIITSDHGGGGDRGEYSHGSTNVVDMTIPLFIIGDGFEADKALDFDVSILDVAPTITDIMGVRTESYWIGKSILDAISEK